MTRPPRGPRLKLTKPFAGSRRPASRVTCSSTVSSTLSSTDGETEALRGQPPLPKVVQLRQGLRTSPLTVEPVFSKFGRAVLDLS